MAIRRVGFQGGVFGFIAAAMLVVFVVISAFGPAVTPRRLEAIAA